MNRGTSQCSVWYESQAELVDAAGGFKTVTGETDFRWPDDGICNVFTRCSGYKDIIIHSWIYRKTK